MSTRLRIGNLYYLLCYAWGHLDALGHVPTGVLEAERPLDFFARLLRGEVARRLRRGLDRSYVVEEEETARPRGRILIGASLASARLQHGRLLCEREELSVDVLHNRLLKATLRALLAAEGLDAGLRADLHGLCGRMASVRDVPLSRRAFRRIQLHRSNLDYRFPLHVCELVARCLLMEPGDAGAAFDRFLGDEREMGALFEAFVRGFLAREQSAYRVKTERLGWPGRGYEPEHERLLPVQRTDVTLLAPGRRVVIETKFVEQPLVRGLGRAKLRASHLRQLLSYLASGDQPVEAPPVGILLYARADRDLDLGFDLHGHPVIVRTLDLRLTWTALRDELLELVPRAVERAARASGADAR